MTLLRGAAESGRFDHWLKQQVWPLEQRWLDAEYVRDGTELAIADMITSGTTCFADMHLFPEVVAQTAADAKIRACIASPIVDFATAWAGSTDEYLDKGLRLHDEYRNDPLISTMLAPYAPWAVSDATLSRVQRLADELESPVTMHVNESRERQRSGRRTRHRAPRAARPAVAAADRGAHGARRMRTISSARRAAASASLIARNRISSSATASRRVSAFREAGLNIALGTDGAASNNDLSMLDEMRTAALLASGERAR